VLFPQYPAVAEWLGRWVDGRAYQPMLVKDPVAGGRRGATDEEYEGTFEAELCPDVPQDGEPGR
jgi:hypothetical protein